MERIFIHFYKVLFLVPLFNSPEERQKKFLTRKTKVDKTVNKNQPANRPKFWSQPTLSKYILYIYIYIYKDFKE